MKDVDVPEKVHHERIGRMIEHLLRRARLFDPAVVHHDDPVGDFEGFFLIVRDEDGRQVNLFVQPAEPLPQLLPHLGVERPERLVEQQHPRLHRQGPGQGDRCRCPPDSCDG